MLYADLASTPPHSSCCVTRVVRHQLTEPTRVLSTTDPAHKFTWLHCLLDIRIVAITSDRQSSVTVCYSSRQVPASDASADQATPAMAMIQLAKDMTRMTVDDGGGRNDGRQRKRAWVTPVYPAHGLDRQAFSGTWFQRTAPPQQMGAPQHTVPPPQSAAPGQTYSAPTQRAPARPALAPSSGFRFLQASTASGAASPGSEAGRPVVHRAGNKAAAGQGECAAEPLVEDDLLAELEFLVDDWPEL